MSQIYGFSIVQPGHTLNPLQASAGMMGRIRKRDEETLESVKAERALLLKELNHRVRNMIQTILSLTALQSDAVRDPSLRRLFNENSQRIRVLGIVLDKAGQEGSIGEADIKECVTEIAAHLCEAMYLETRSVSVEATGERIKLPTDSAISFGIIMNEILQAVLSKAKGGKPCCTVSIWNQEQAGLATVTIKESGFCFSAWDEKPDSIGYALVQHLSKQIDASLSLDKQEKTLRLFLKVPKQKRQLQ
jgi:two-component sensor histidine kinase